MRTVQSPMASMAMARFIAAVAAGASIGGCGSPAAHHRPRSQPTAVSPPASCPITRPHGQKPPASALRGLGGQVIGSADDPGWIGAGALWTRLPLNLPSWRDKDTGLISLKHLWFRAGSGQVRLAGKPLTGATAVFKADVGTVAAYGPTGFDPSILEFGRPGCWKISASLGDDRLDLVIDVPAPGSGVRPR